MVMRWIAVAIYVALVGYAWITAGVGTGLILIGCALFLTAVMRPNAVGDTITGIARLLFRRPSPRSS
jgi:hypothetical protein